MWKKEEDQTQRPSPAATTRSEQTATQTRKAGFATIGPSIVIRGEVTGDEDLLIQGRVEGSVALGLHSVTIGDGGRVKAGITGRVITVEGAVEGDLTAEEQIVLRGTAQVKGDLSAPRVVLEDGATFRGLVDMGRAPELDAPEATSSPDTGKGGSATKVGAKPASSAAAHATRSTNGTDKTPVTTPDKSAATSGSDKSATA